MLSRFLIAIVAVIALASGALLIEQNLRLKHRLQVAERTLQATAPADLIGLGDSILRLSIVDEPTGVAVTAKELLRQGATVFFFYIAHCGSCEAELPDWQDYLAAARDRSSNVVFVACNREPPTPGLAALFRQGVRQLRLGKANPLRGRLRELPLIVAVDTCGIVVGVYHSVTQLPPQS